MRKFLLLVAVAVATSATAQLTTREAAPNTYKLGAYPQAGDLSLMFSLVNLTNFDSDSNAQSSNIAGVNSLGRGDLITAKYYLKDDFAIRAGLKLQREVSGKSSFDTDTSSELFTQDPSTISPLSGAQDIAETSTKEVFRDWALKVGAEKHFNSANFFDVYAGADLYLGLGKESFESKTTTDNGTLTDTESGFSTVENITSSRGYTKIGVLPFVGVQMFVLDLPISVGIEYGWDALWKFGGLFKNDIEITQEGLNSSGDLIEESVSGTYYSEDQITNPRNLPTGSFGQNGSSGSSILNTNQNVKLLVNIYFGRGGSSSSDVIIE